ncbi:hypothetical protein LINPERHAP1_LOCUS41953 [Linum perenne]
MFVFLQKVLQNMLVCSIRDVWE